ncbi:hypothetical protein HETIRDRAFT_471296 [Heterobasidion irregulare TC 32-1]|uniref:Uncharacterized protein n=1 Tax=Heterobasidion irregulare (strain TC 32-1) TaxID=747525 RepID=W4KJY9_HETIT|nr:uncharacterized protein HETIRDRAFT_471296 [Heterobasidion irregulare TC 32-1]ETW86019.1 hypothetical protein HETIRDRAFT_471296 [Heterobasidion irregulare TC 32-1]
MQMSASLLSHPSDNVHHPQMHPQDLHHEELRSPVSISGSFVSSGHFDMSPSLSPIDARLPHEFPAAGSMHLSPLSPKHEPLQAVLHPSAQEDHMLSFDSSTHTFPKRPKASQPAETDPFAAAFLQDQIGDEKWNIFSARLYERRLGGSKARTRGKKSPAEHEPRNSGASAIEFLVKVEVVKEVLRVYVPHPYNPFKSLTHAYDRSPTGYVVLTRATILSLSGWSNTQFSYWARRAEAVSVLAQHDTRLHEVAVALERRLHPSVVASQAQSWPQPLTCPSPSSPPSPLTPLSSSSSGASISPPTTLHDLPEPTVTGKGLDQLIDDVKRRTGASPFLRGKHASLDPFGAPGGDREAPPAAAAVYTPTFQTQMYTHEAPPPASAVDSATTSPAKKKRKRRESDCTSPSGESAMPALYAAKTEPNFDGGVVLGGAGAGGQDASPNRADQRRVLFCVSASRAATPPCVSQTMVLKRRRLSEDAGGARVDSFPVSDSRSETDGPPRKRARTGTI